MTGTDFNLMEEEFQDLMKKDYITSVINGAEQVSTFLRIMERLEIEAKNKWAKDMERYVQQRALQFAQKHPVQLNLFERK